MKVKVNESHVHWNWLGCNDNNVDDHHGDRDNDNFVDDDVDEKRISKKADNDDDDDDDDDDDNGDVRTCRAGETAGDGLSPTAWTVARDSVIFICSLNSGALSSSSLSLLPEMDIKWT